MLMPVSSQWNGWQLFGSNRLNDELSFQATGFGFQQLNTSSFYEPKRNHPPLDWPVWTVTERGEGKGAGFQEA
jgi:hypothetical protein